ncbi:hypothetical protein NL676_002553 [Syzygium grande]|nr:hypothetical protein NL676_002553 [Syzygium grande]
MAEPTLRPLAVAVVHGQATQFVADSPFASPGTGTKRKRKDASNDRSSSHSLTATNATNEVQIWSATCIWRNSIRDNEGRGREHAAGCSGHGGCAQGRGWWRVGRWTRILDLVMDDPCRERQ